ncbi:MAG: Na+/H+ antiporter subunit E [bacterium]|nr:Na+/H+ antiporter subunit E [bacterium]
MILSLLTLPLRFVAFALWFAWQIVRSTGAVLADVVTPGVGATPRVVRMPLGDASDSHVAWISILITLTPGTLTIGAAENDGGGRSILVHSLYHRDAEGAITDLADMDRRMMESVRIGGAA